jgi:glycosyltransferase involved in cell wall biosynthesis
MPPRQNASAPQLTSARKNINLTFMNPAPFISFITPVYNEEENIARMLANLFAILNTHPEWNWEVILIEDGSKDKTREVLQSEAAKYPNTTLLIHEKNQGYNRSLRDGILASRGEYLMYVGADEEFDSSEIPSFVEILRKKEADVLLGVRWQRNAYQLFRFFLSVIYIFFLNWLYKIRINDYNWSQAWNRKVLERIELTSESLFVLPEIIVKAHDLGFRIKEIPSNHRGRQWGKSSLNMKIMGKAIWDSVEFGLLRRSKKYSPASNNPFLKPR